jgi:hypothetical protein
MRNLMALSLRKTLQHHSLGLEPLLMEISSNSLLDTISSTEGVDGNSWFIGESNGTTDFICSAKQ